MSNLQPHVCEDVYKRQHLRSRLPYPLDHHPEKSALWYHSPHSDVYKRQGCTLQKSLYFQGIVKYLLCKGIDSLVQETI